MTDKGEGAARPPKLPRVDAQRLEGLSDADVRDVADALRERGYDDVFIAKTEAIAPARFDRVRLPVVHAWLRDRDDAASLVARLFAYADVVATTEVERCLGARLCTTLREAGLLRANGQGMRGGARIMPFCGLMFLSDEADASQDPVMGPGATTLELARALPERIRGSVLDLGCGAGSLALVAASRGASHVVGLDIDPRAVAMSAFNARLNRLEAAFEAGDLFAPVRGRRFDLIISQPPFVTLPPDVAATTYLHGGERGDELALRLLGEVTEVLAPGGRALVLFDTPAASGAEVWPRVNAAIGEVPVQCIALAAPGLDPDRQSIGYAAAAHPALDDAYAAAALRYRAHLRRLGVEATRHVLLDLRRPQPGEPAFAVTLEPPRLAGIGAEALDEIRAAVRLGALDDEALADAPVRISEKAWLASEQRLDGADAPVRLRVHFDGGRGQDQELSEAASIFLDTLRGADSMRAALIDYAAAAGTTPQEVLAPTMAFVRQALASGILVAGG